MSLFLVKGDVWYPNWLEGYKYTTIIIANMRHEDEVKKRHDSRLEPLEKLDEETRKEFRQKFRALARRIHPDMVAPRDEAEKEQYDELYKEALEAYSNADFSKMNEIEKEADDLLYKDLSPGQRIVKKIMDKK